jgi:hypothetical protein
MLVSGPITGPGQLTVSQEDRDGEVYTVIEGNTDGSTEPNFKLSLKGAHILDEDDFSF